MHPINLKPVITTLAAAMTSWVAASPAYADTPTVFARHAATLLGAPDAIGGCAEAGCMISRDGVNGRLTVVRSIEVFDEDGISQGYQDGIFAAVNLARADGAEVTGYLSCTPDGQQCSSSFDFMPKPSGPKTVAEAEAFLDQLTTHLLKAGKVERGGAEQDGGVGAHTVGTGAGERVTGTLFCDAEGNCHTAFRRNVQH